MIKCDGSLRRIANELVDCKSVGKIVFGEDVVGEGTQNYKKTWLVLGLRLGTVCGRLENSILILIDTSERDGMSQASHSSNYSYASYNGMLKTKKSLSCHIVTSPTPSTWY